MSLQLVLEEPSVLPQLAKVLSRVSFSKLRVEDKDPELPFEEPMQIGVSSDLLGRWCMKCWRLKLHHFSPEEFVSLLVWLSVSIVASLPVPTCASMDMAAMPGSRCGRVAVVGLLQRIAGDHALDPDGRRCRQRRPDAQLGVLYSRVCVRCASITTMAASNHSSRGGRQGNMIDASVFSQY